MAEPNSTPPNPPGGPPGGPIPVDVVRISDQGIFNDFNATLLEIQQSMQQMTAAFSAASGGGEGPTPSTVSDGGSRATSADPSGGGGMLVPPGLMQGPSPTASNAPNPIKHPYQYMQSVMQGQAAPGWVPPYQRDPNEEYTGPGVATSLLHGASQYVAPLALWNVMPNVGQGIQAAAGMFAPPALSQLSTQYGVPPSQGSQQDIGPFRLPFTAWGTGISQTAQSLWQGISTPGLSSAQVMQGKASLADLGWTADRPGFGALSGAVNELAQKDPRLDPTATAPLLDQATRLGATSLEDFTNVLKNVPEAAKAAQVSVGQMLTDMNALGEANQSQGGTFAQGAALGPLWSGTTGLPATAVPGLMQNPFVSAYATRSSGLMPQMQGIMSPGDRIQSIYGAINQLSKVTSFQGYNNKIAGTPFTEHVGGQQENRAFIHTLIPEASNEMIRAMTNPKTRDQVMAGAQLDQVARAWEYHARQRDAQGRKWGAVMDQVQGARDLHGKKMFSADQLKELQGLSVTSGTVRDEAGRILKQHGGTTDLATSAGRKALNDALIHQRRQLIEKDIQGQGTKAQQQTGPKVTIELGPAARQMFQISSKTGNTKAQAGAGASTTVSGFTNPSSIMPFGPTTGSSARAGQLFDPTMP